MGAIICRLHSARETRSILFEVMRPAEPPNIALENQDKKESFPIRRSRHLMRARPIHPTMSLTAFAARSAQQTRLVRAPVLRLAHIVVVRSVTHGPAAPSTQSTLGISRIIEAMRQPALHVFRQTERYPC